MEIRRFPYISVCRVVAPVVLALLVLLGSASCTGHRPPRTDPSARAPAEPVAEPPAAPQPSAEDVFHFVRPGETLWRIARAYGLTVDELAAANGIADPTRIAVGMRLHIPGAESKVDVPDLPRSRATAGRGSGEPWAWPVRDGRILSYFGAPRRTHKHQGIDIAGRSGQRVLAAAPGRVVHSGPKRGYGRTVVVDHGDGFRTLYAHNSALLVRDGDRVRQGQAIARVGRSGNATTEHCHFEVRRNNVPVDPLLYVEPGRGETR